LGQLAEQTGGLASFISTSDNFEQQAQAFRRKLTHPAATSVKITLDGAETYDVEPQLLPNLYYGQPLRMYGRYKKSGAAKVQVSAEVLGSPLAQTIDVTLPDRDETNPEIERMWAQHRVERLMNEDRRDGSQGHQSEIVRLCEGYSITSEYASFIVLENDAEYQRWKIERRNAVRVSRDRGAQLAVRKRLEELRQQTAESIGPSADKTTKQAANSANSSVPLNQVARRDPSDQFVQGPVDRSPSVGGGGGGGAFDPISALAAASLAGLGWAMRRKKGGEG
jgi:Ca-activated chloride channel family protein